MDVYTSVEAEPTHTPHTHTHTLLPSGRRSSAEGAAQSSLFDHVASFHFILIQSFWTRETVTTATSNNTNLYTREDVDAEENNNTNNNNNKASAVFTDPNQDYCSLFYRSGERVSGSQLCSCCHLADSGCTRRDYSQPSLPETHRVKINTTRLILE